MTSTSTISVLIPTFNEEMNLPDCIASVRDIAGQIVVIDSFSRDRTVEIAKAAGAEVIQRAYDGPATQKNFALDNVAWLSKWILILDADERVSPELAEEIHRIVARDGDGMQAFHVNRRFIFYGRWMKHCWYPSWNVRLFRAGTARYEDRPVHEHMIVHGTTGYLKHDLIHNDLRDMTHWIANHNRYSSSEAAQMARRIRGEQDAGLQARLLGTPLERRRWIKNRLWPRLPGKGLFLFSYLYFWKRGFMDGREGLHFCLMHGIFEHFNEVKLWEMQQPPADNYYRELASRVRKGYRQQTCD